MRIVLPVLLAIACAPLLAAEKEQPLGRSLNQRFNGSLEEQQALVFDPRQGATGGGRSFNAGAARTKEFHFNQRYTATKYQTGEFTQTKKSWWGNFKFGAKAANLPTKSAIPNVNSAAQVKTASTKEARESDQEARVRALPGRDRAYLGPESKKLDNAVDPNKPLPGWTGDRMDTMSLEQIRELLNKNK